MTTFKASQSIESFYHQAKLSAWNELVDFINADKISIEKTIQLFNDFKELIEASTDYPVKVQLDDNKINATINEFILESLQQLAKDPTSKQIQPVSEKNQFFFLHLSSALADTTTQLGSGFDNPPTLGIANQCGLLAQYINTFLEVQNIQLPSLFRIVNDSKQSALNETTLSEHKEFVYNYFYKTYLKNRVAEIQDLLKIWQEAKKTFTGSNRTELRELITKCANEISESIWGGNYGDKTLACLKDNKSLESDVATVYRELTSTVNSKIQNLHNLQAYTTWSKQPQIQTILSTKKIQYRQTTTQPTNQHTFFQTLKRSKSPGLQSAIEQIKAKHQRHSFMRLINWIFEKLHQLFRAEKPSDFQDGFEDKLDEINVAVFTMA